MNEVVDTDVIRPMTEADLPRVMEIEIQGHAFPWTEGIFRDCLRVGYICHVLERDGDVIGYGVMSTGAGEAHIFNVCVDPAFQRHGIGRRIMMHLLDLARVRHVTSVFLEVRPSNTAAVRLYDSLGFNEAGVRRGYYPAKSGREDALILVLHLG